jgi:hypothetical protein
MRQTWLADLNDLQATLPARIDAYFTKKVCKKGTMFSDFLKLIIPLCNTGGTCGRGGKAKIQGNKVKRPRRKAKRLYLPHTKKKL